MDQIQKDSKFLADNNIIDYSLLLGVHYNQEHEEDRSAVGDRLMKIATISGPKKAKTLGNAAFSKKPADSLKRNSELQVKSRSESKKNIRDLFPLVTLDGKYTLYFGIIDTLTPFNRKKWMEYSFKKLALGKGISCVPPDQYSRRFYEFLRDQVFVDGGDHSFEQVRIRDDSIDVLPSV